MKKTFLLLFLFIVFTINLQSQSILTIGTPSVISSNTECTPINIFYRSNHCQILYTPSEIIAAGWSGNGIIYGLGFNVVSTTSEALPNFTLKLKNTTNNDLNTYDGTGLTTVYSNSAYMPAAGGFDMLTFSNSFIWDGTSNILVDVCFDQVSAYTQTGQLYTYANNPNEFKYVRADNASQCGVATTSSDNNNKPQIQIAITTTNQCSGVPNNGNATASDSSVCAGSIFNLNLQNEDPNIGVVFQWQSSQDSITWTNLGSSQTSSFYQVTAGNPTVFYRCVSTCTNSALTATSTPVKVTLNPSFNCHCTINASNAYNCSTDNINSFNIANITWHPTSCDLNGYSDSTSSSSTIINLTAGQTYTLSMNALLSGNYGNGAIGGWIDFNTNGIFESTEFINLGYGLSGIYTNTFVVPVNTSQTFMRMRLLLYANFASSSTIISPCPSAPAPGQILDYKVFVTAAPLCTGMPNAGNATSTSTSICTGDSFTLDLVNNDPVSGTNYQWQSSPDGVTWTNFGVQNSTIPSYVSNQNQTTYYRCLMNCMPSSSTATSTPITVNQKAITNCYCIPSTLDCTTDSITKVMFGSLNDSPNGDSNINGYIDNTILVLAPNMNANQNYNLTCIFKSSLGDGYLGAWIDFNKNGTFETSEFTNMGTGNNTDTLTKSINIPFDAVGGNTRMRLMLISDWNPVTLNPCSNVNNFYGQAIDYLLNIIPSPTCTGTPNAGITISDSSVCTFENVTLNLSGNDIVSGMTYQWQSSPDNVSWTSLGSPQTNVKYVFSGQTSSTYYRCLLTCNSSSLSSTSASTLVAQKAFNECYCTPDTSDCTYDAIYRVGINTLNNVSTCSNMPVGYSDYFNTAGLTTTLTIGQSYQTTVKLSDISYQNVTIWIDYDHNGSFDTNEYILLGSSDNSTDSIVSVITIPSNALTGVTRMRVRNNYMNALTPSDQCYSPNVFKQNGQQGVMAAESGRGESEDYKITIVAPDCSTLNYPPSMTLSGKNKICLGDSSNITISPVLTPTNAAGLEYQWYSTESGSWNTYGIPTQISNIQAKPSSNAMYYSDVLCHGTSMKKSDTIQVSVQTITTSVVKTNSSCYNACNGTITLNASATNSSLSYAWSPNISSNDNASNLCPGNYIVSISDTVGCSKVDTINITEPSQISLSISGNTLTCMNSVNSYSSNIANAIAPITYSWSATTASLTSTNPTFNFTATTTGNETLNLSIVDANGCAASSSSYSIVTLATTNLSGTVTSSPSTPVSGRVILYQYMPFFTKFDSVAGQNLGAAGDYNFVSFNSGTYIVKAIPASTSLQITYGDSAVSWMDATQINHSCLANDIQNIKVKSLDTLTTTGTGLLSGLITEGQGFGQKPNKTNGVTIPGNPIGGIIVKGGKNPGGQMFVQTTTNSNGTYTLSGLPDNAFGESYFILVDVPGLDTNNTYHRTITVSNNNYTNLDFVIDSTKINPVNGAQVGIQNIENIEGELKVYPNPTNGILNIQYKLIQASNVKIEICDMLGKTVKTLLNETQQNIDKQNKQWYLDEISNGLYFVKININGNENVIKISVNK
jgi:hypothetical protein